MRLASFSILLLAFAPAHAATYYAEKYPSDHWALRYPEARDEGFIARFKFGKFRYAAILHPLDGRGYRSLVTRVEPDMASTLNRPFSFAERHGLIQAMNVVAEAYEALGLIAQLEVLGNNAHVFEPETRHLTLGSAHEPSILHGHVIGRGDPEAKFISGIPLGGPPPGEIFDVRGRPRAWAPGQRARVARALADQVVMIVGCNVWLAGQGLTLDEFKGR